MKRPFFAAIFVGFVAACMGVSVLSPAAGGGSAPVTLPKRPAGLTSPVEVASASERGEPAVDPASPYAPQVSCSPRDMPGPVKLRDLVLATYRVGGKGNIGRSCTAGVSEHSEGRAWDWMVNVRNAKEKAAAADFLSWLTADNGANARRLGIMYVIYNKKIWAIYRVREGWRTSSGHTDHIHVSFGWAGARAKTSFWTGKPSAIDYGPCMRFAGQPAVLRSTPRATGCYLSAPLVKQSKNATLRWGARSAALKTAQSALKVKKTGVFDNATWSAVKSYQKKHDLPWTGALDQPTWVSLVPASVRSDVSKGYTPAKAAGYGLKKYAKNTTAERATGTSVLMLQTALGMPRGYRNGYFGSRTTAAVKALQRQARRKQTGAVTKAEWEALAKRTAALS